jgi:hypothetical protein
MPYEHGKPGGQRKCIVERTTAEAAFGITECTAADRSCRRLPIELPDTPDS